MKKFTTISQSSRPTRRVTRGTVGLLAAALSLMLTMCGDNATNVDLADVHGNSDMRIITFNKNGGTGDAPETQFVNRGESVTLPGRGNLERSGYTFAGWKDGETIYAAGQSVKPDGDMLLYADWRSTHTIIFDPNGGDHPLPVIAYGEGMTLTLPNENDMARSGYRLDRWDSERDGTGSSYDLGAEFTVPSSNTVLYAQWSLVTYTITYDLNGGTASSDNPATYNTETETFTLDNPTRTHYTFDGWTGSNGESPEITVIIPTGSTDDKTYFANWTAITYTITYNLDGGTNHASNPASYSIESEEVTLHAPARAGYAFAGWYDNSDLTGSAVTSIPEGSTGDRTYWAKWVAIYTITFDANGGSVTPASGVTDTDRTLASLPTPTRSGYSFIGWFTAATDGAAVTTSTAFDSDATIYAQWSLNVYTITYNLNGGTNHVLNPALYTILTPAITLGAPTRSGYTFDGWFANAAFEGAAVTSIPAGSTGDKALWAKWTAVTPPPEGSYTETGGGVNFDMIAVQGGTFTMGCTSEQGSDCWSGESPSHQVTVSSFYIMRHEVTQKLWLDVMGTTPWTSCSNAGVGDNYPVYCVSWNDIVNDFIPALNAKTSKTYRLPTEAEWEYAARGGNQSQGNKYSGSNSIDDVAWYWSNSSNGTKPVGTKQANELGIYDMSGNVWEWVQDWHDSYTSADKTDPTGPQTGSARVGRSGGWGSDARNCRVSNRINFTPGTRAGSIGFRLVLSP